MSSTVRAAQRRDDGADEPIGGRTVIVLCALSYLAVALAFAFLDRRLQRFGAETLMWTAWAALGFGLRIVHHGHPERARKATRLLLVISAVLFVFPGFLLFALARWLAFGLLLVTAARAGAMRQRRDLYYALAAIAAVSLLVVIHPTATWTVWFYLAPAWLLLALTLAWDYAAHVRLGAGVKAGLTTAFLAACIAVAMAFVTLVPQPSVMGFGFLEPGTEHPGRVKIPGGSEGPQGEGRAGGGSKAGEGEGSAGGGRGLLGDALRALRDAARDQSLPQWQRGMVEAMLLAAQGAARLAGAVTVPGAAADPEELERRAAALLDFLLSVLAALLLALLAWLLWRLRWRLATAAAFTGAWALVGVAPAQSMRCSTWALRGMLRRAGHPLQPGQSLLEHVDSARMLPERGRQWLRTAVLSYGEHRFGGAPASPQRARGMRRAVVASDELLRARK